METIDRAKRGLQELCRLATTTPCAAKPGKCQHCREFTPASTGFVKDRALFCSSYCYEQDSAMRQGW